MSVKRKRKSTAKRLAERKEASSSYVKRTIDDKVFKDAIDDFDRFDDFVTTNWNKIVVGAVLLTLASVVGYLVYVNIDQRDRAACAVLTSAETIDEINAALSEHPGNKGAALARLSLGTLYFNDEQYDMALEAYREVAGEGMFTDISGRARLNVGYTLEAMGRSDEAAEHFVSAGMDSALPEYVRKEANYSGGRIYLSLGKIELARSSLKAISIGDRGDFWESQAERMLQRMASKDPLPEPPPMEQHPLEDDRVPERGGAAPEAS
ncbi:MAG: hypothetical protein JW808_04400 [Victivallales bacterium]|nr:hypothetical protein [Victivallales bacterium]